MKLWGKFGMGSISCHESIWLRPASKLTILPRALGRLSHCKNKDYISDLILRWEMKPLHGTSQWSRLMRSFSTPGVADRNISLLWGWECCVCQAGAQALLCLQTQLGWPMQKHHFRVGKDPSPIPKKRKVLEQTSLPLFKAHSPVLAAVGRSSIRKAPHHISPEHLPCCPGTGAGLPQKQLFSDLLHHQGSLCHHFL